MKRKKVKNFRYFVPPFEIECLEWARLKKRLVVYYNILDRVGDFARTFILTHRNYYSKLLSLVRDFFLKTQNFRILLVLYFHYYVFSC